MKNKCTGCGITLQNQNKNLPGYVDKLDKNICERCFKLSNYGEYKKVSLTNKDYLKLLNSIDKNDLVLYISDILTLNLDYLNKFNKVLLVISKRDILPKSIKDNKIINYIKKKYPNIIDIVIICSINNYNLDTLYNKIIEHNNNNKVYIVGSTNSGKSTLINKLIKNYGNNNSKVTTSIYPSTTLDKIIIKLNNLTIIDTPGLINEHSIINNLSKEELKKITPKKEIKPKTYQTKSKGSIIIDKFIRLDYLTNNPNSIVIYMSNSLNIKINSLKNNKLKNLPLKEYNLKSNQDIVIEGLGFIKFTNPINLKIYLDKNLKITIRDNLI